MYLEIFLVDFAVFRVFWGISRDFAEIPEFRGSATARNIRSPAYRTRLLDKLSSEPFLHSLDYIELRHELKAS